MKVTFPHLGNIYLGAKALFDGLGIDYVIPPLNSKLSLEIGSLQSPEEICMPFKIMIGNYIQAIEKGADTVIILGSCGPCRFGEYCEMQMKLFKKLGYNLEFILIDAPKEIGIKELFNRINKISSKSQKAEHEKIRAVYDALKVINIIDDIEAKAHYLAGYEKNKGECKQILNKCRDEALACNNPRKMVKLLVNYKKRISNIEIDSRKNPIKIAIIGEIYTIIDPLSNLFIEDKLMDYGVSTKRILSPSWWIKNTLLMPGKLSSGNIRKAAKEYIPLSIGGFSRECIGEAVLAKEEGFHGAIQIFPVGCMPEIVSKSILTTVSKDKNFPIMSLVVDEMTGEAGYITRIEAFVDLLERRQEKCII